ncbi:MAG: O-antigen ligase family protein [Acidobacteriota bacterium]
MPAQSPLAAAPDDSSRRPWASSDDQGVGLWASAALPAALVAAGAVLGGWQAAADATSVLALHGLLFGLVAVVALRLPRLSGRRLGALGLLTLPAAGVVLLSHSLSPVPRAGATGLTLLPALLAVVPATAAAWRTAAARRRGAVLLALAVAGVALWSLGGWLWDGTPGASLPLGHHNLLAVFLVATLPVTTPSLMRPPVTTPPVTTPPVTTPPVTTPPVTTQPVTTPPVTTPPVTTPPVTTPPVTTQPVTTQPTAGRQARRAGLGGRLASWLALASGVAAVVASRSLGGLVGLVVAFVVLTWWRRDRLRHRARAAGLRDLGAGSPSGGGALAVGLLAVGLLSIGVCAAGSTWLGPRLVDLVRGDDASATVRQLYARAALRGVAERPLLGWGPGASAWLLPRHLALEQAAGDGTVARLLPTEQVVTDAHSLPLTLAYELGVGGVAVVGICLVLAFGGLARGRRAEDGRQTAGDEELRQAAAAGLLGAVVTATLSGLPLTVPGPWLALAVVTGLLVAAVPLRGAELDGAPSTRWAPVGFRLAALVGVLGLCAVQLPRDLAHRQASTDEPTRWSRAAALDPAFPAYAWREALEAPPGRATFRQAFGAARAADGLAPLWLSAAVLGLEARGASAPGQWSADDEAALHHSLDRACGLAPGGAMAPFHAAMASTTDDGAAVHAAARAVASEPRLLAAAAWRARPALRAAALHRLVQDAALDPVWRGALDEAWNAVRALLEEDEPGSSRAAATQLVLWVDDEASSSLSLFAFRRPPEPARLAIVELDTRLAAALAVPPLRVVASGRAVTALVSGPCGGGRRP